MAQKKNPLAAAAEFAVAKCLIGGLRYLPLPLSNLFARSVARLLDLSVPRLRQVARTNLNFAFDALDPKGRELLIDGVFRSIARLLVAVARFPDLNRSNIDQWIEYEGLENYTDAKRRAKGVLVATAHLGNWELSAFAHALLTEPMSVMVRPLDNEAIDTMVETRRTLSGNRLVFKTDGARAVLRALRKNDAVGILVDQNTAASEGVFIDFFGRKACANSGFVKLALHSGAAVVPGFAFWDEGKRRYVLRFYPAINMTGDEVADTQAIHTQLENVIRAYPDQWMWIHRRWKTRPLGEGPLY